MLSVTALFYYNPKDLEDYFLVIRIQAIKNKSKGKLILHYSETFHYTHTYIKH